MAVETIYIFQGCIAKVLSNNKELGVKGVYVEKQQHAAYPFLVVDLSCGEMRNSLRANIWNVEFKIHIFSAGNKVESEIVRRVVEGIKQEIVQTSCPADIEVLGIRQQKVLWEMASDLVSRKATIEYEACIRKIDVLKKDLMLLG